MTSKSLRRILAALAVMSLLAACEVGDATIVDPVEGGPDAGEEIAAAWNPLIQPGAPANGPYVHYVSDTEIYSVVNNQICVWNGATWTPLAPPPADNILGNQFHFVAPNQIYAFLKKPLAAGGPVNQVCMWDGTQWIPKTDEVDAQVLNADGALFVIPGAPDQVYAFLGAGGISDKVCLSTGAGFTDMTGVQANLSPNDLHVVGTNIYAVVGNSKLCMSSSPAVPGFDTIVVNDPTSLIGSFEYIADNDIHAVIGGTKICNWQGVAWAPVTDEFTTLLGQFARVGLGYVAATGELINNTVVKWE